MLYQLAVGEAEHDSGVLDIAQLSARLAYAMMCLALCWGALTSMGWVSRLTGRQALRSSHMVLSTLTLAFVAVHGLAFLYLRAQPWTLVQVLVPFNSGAKLPQTLGTLAFEGMLASAVVVGLRRWLSYYRWLWLHRLAYPAFALGVLHALLSAMANGHLGFLWLGGIALLMPAVTLAGLRFLPAKALATTGLIEDAP
ncbi:MAG: ferric reductase-like transmembrane domain-containing protein [Labedaea sp.]